MDLKIKTLKLTSKEKELIKQHIKKIKQPKNLVKKAKNFRGAKKSFDAARKASDSARNFRTSINGASSTKQQQGFFDKIFGFAGDKLDNLTGNVGDFTKKINSNPIIQKHRMNMAGIADANDFRQYSNLVNDKVGVGRFADFMDNPLDYSKGKNWNSFVEGLDPTRRAYVNQVKNARMAEQQARRVQNLRNNLPYIGIGVGTGLGALALNKPGPQAKITNYR